MRCDAAHAGLAEPLLDALFCSPETNGGRKKKRRTCPVPHPLELCARQKKNDELPLREMLAQGQKGGK